MKHCANGSIRGLLVCIGVGLALYAGAASGRTVHDAQQLVQALITAQNQPGLSYIVLDAGVYGTDPAVEFPSRHGPSAFPVIRTPVTLIGSGAQSTQLDGGNRERRLFTVEAGGLLTIVGTSLGGGVANAYDTAATMGGGAIANFGGRVTLTDCVVENNAAVGYGGGLLNQDGALTLLRVRVSDNQASGEGWGGGGGIAVVSGDFRMTESTVSGNRTDAIDHNYPGGGGLFISRDVWHPSASMDYDTRRLPDPIAVIRHSRIEANLAGGEDAELLAYSTATAGGIHKTGEGRLLIENTAIVGNRARGGYWAYGGGLVVSGGNNVIVNSSILDNEATYRGAGLMVTGALDFHGVTISRNRITRDAAQYCFESTGEYPYPCSGAAGLFISDTAEVRIDQTLIADNRLLESSEPDQFVAPDCWGTVHSTGYNAIGDTQLCNVNSSAPDTDLLNVDAELGEIQYGERPRAVYILPYGTSPIIDAGKPYLESTTYSPSCTPRDQVGTARQDGDRDGLRECDIGAAEYR
ncbi:MAG: hypothetical protein R3E84_19790 [Pseudomonadales bacterium]